MSIPMITADLMTATDVISRLAAAPLQQKCAAIQDIAATGVPVDQLTVRQLMDIAMKAAPVRVGTASMVATSTAPQRREIVRLLNLAGLDTTTVHDGLKPVLEQARVLLPKGLQLETALRSISYAGAARLLRAARLATLERSQA